MPQDVSLVAPQQSASPVVGSNSEVSFIGNHEMASLEPNSWLTDSSSANMPLMRMVAPSLVMVDDALELKPALATSWEPSASFDRYRFVLRDDVVLHDGTSLDADLVVWNFERIYDPRTNSTSVLDFQSLEGVRAVDKRTVEFRFTRPFPAFPYHLPWSAHITSRSLIQPVGAGPYRVVEWLRGSHLRLERFDRYYESGWPQVGSILIRFAPHGPQRLQLIKNGDADVVEGVSAKAIPELRSAGLLDIASVKSSRKMIVAFNCKRPPFDDVRVRRAVAHAIDREAIRKDFYGEHAQPLHSSYPPADFWAAEVEPYAFDPDRARHLLRAAGHERIAVPHGITTNVAPTPAVGARIAEYLRAVGIDLTLTGYEDPPWWPFVYLTHDWQFAVQNFPARTHPEALFRRDHGTGGPFNGTHYSNPKLDDLLAHAQTLADRAEQKRAYDDAQRILHEDLPILPLLSPDVIVGTKPVFTGFRPHPLQYVDLTRLRRKQSA